MRRGSVLVAVVVVALVGWFAGAHAPLNAGAQSGTPAPEAFDPPPGLAFESLAFGPVATLPPVPAFAAIDRITLAPGANLPGEPGDPTFAILYVERGTVTVRADAQLGVTRAAALAAPGTLPATEEVAAGTDFTLAAGDSTVFPPLVGVEFRNDGLEEAVVLATTIAPAETEAGTPAPE